jgi:hypothetical protein
MEEAHMKLVSELFGRAGRVRMRMRQAALHPPPPRQKERSQLSIVDIEERNSKLEESLQTAFESRFAVLINEEEF